jgi:protein-tyrosine kinase
MSLIEEALRKAVQLGTAGRGAPATKERPVRFKPTPATSVPARPFRKVDIDTEAQGRHLVLPTLSDMSVLRSYKILRTRVLQRMQAENWRSLAVTATAVGEGKSVTAINLSIALAQELNTWVFLVDMDLQRPRVADYLGLSVDKGLSDYLQDRATFDEIVYESAIHRLAVVPNSRAIEQSSELLSSPRMAEFLRALEAEQPARIMVFDMPPLLVSDDVLAFAPRVDSFLLVVAEGHTARRMLESAGQVLADKNLLGVVLNRSAERNESAYY